MAATVGVGQSEVVVPSADRARRALEILIVLGAVVGAVGAGFAVVLVPLVAPLLVALVIFAAVVAEPVRAAYLFVALTPVVVGFDRGSLVPIVRPSEGLLALLLLAVFTRMLIEGLAGNAPSYRLTRLDISILIMAVFGSIVPLLWRMARGFTLELDDILYATILWKYFLVFALFRLVVHKERDVNRCLWMMLSVGVIVAVVAILQSMRIAGVPELLGAVYNQELRVVTANRGTSTIGNSHAVADVMAMNLAISVGFLYKGHPKRRTLIALSWLFALGCLASGQFSAFFAIITVVILLGWLTGRTKSTLATAIPGFAVSLVLLRPVLDARFASTAASGVPSSWEARLMNLQNYFWPELRRSQNWILGVRPAARLPSFEPWREWVVIESGQTWLLWTGGIPFLLAYLWFSWMAWTTTRPLANSDGVMGVLGIGAASAFAVIFVLMSFDVHLTLRGAADALFPLLAMATIPVVTGRLSR